MNPLVSVLMVAHNAGPYLAPAVASILTQSWPHWELILVDNASSDSSVQDLTARGLDPRIRILPQTRNLFHGGGLNAGLPHCRGDFVAIMDADDLSLPQRLELQIQALQSHSGIDGVGCRALTIDAAGAVTGAEFMLADPDEIQLFTRYDMPFNFPTLTLRRSLLDGHTFPMELNTPDFDLLNRSIPRHRFLGLTETLFHYRRHATSVTASRRATLFACGSVVRIAGARRAAGHPEQLAALIAEKDNLLAGSPAESAVFAHYARLALSEGHLDQAIWHARKAAVFGERFAGAMLLLKALLATRHRPPAERRSLQRFGFLGTIKAYRLHPA
jgi:glycosyltransferase involved in cell wall biosynthesis